MMNLIPNANELWRGIGGTFDSLIEVLGELIDNSIANIRANKIENSIISINIEEKNGKVDITIEDGGTGVKNIESALRFGDKSGQEDSLNEHGFGMKHSLASANPENDSWDIFTRTAEDVKNNIYRHISAPYEFKKEERILKGIWPGKVSKTGTIIKFSCSKLFFNSVKRGIGGNPSFKRCLDYLLEDIGFLYAYNIKDGEVNIALKSNSINYNKKVKAILPDWAGFYRPKRGVQYVDLGAGEVKVYYVFGEVFESEYAKHYKKNQSTNGCEIRINNRLFMQNEFKNIWKIENHPSYNHFLCLINIISEDSSRLPSTKTNKSGFRIGDEKFERLCDWIRKVFPNPPKSLSSTVNERELIDRLADLKKKHITGDLTNIIREFNVYNRIGCPVRVDLYVFDGKEIYLYEAKKDNLEPINVYQLKMYWDGAVSDGLNPKKGILLASECSKGVQELINDLNNLKDAEGNYYNILFKTWIDEGIEYPTL